MVGICLELVMWLSFGLRCLILPVLGLLIWICAYYRGLSRHMWVLVLGFAGLLASTLWGQFSGLVFRHVGMGPNGGMIGMWPSPQAWYGLHYGFGAVVSFGSWCLITSGLTLVFADVRRLLTIALEHGRPEQESEQETI